jgi:hypothetical protein
LAVATPTEKVRILDDPAQRVGDITGDETPTELAAFGLLKYVNHTKSSN